MTRRSGIYLLLALGMGSFMLRAQTAPSSLDELVRQRRWSELRAATSHAGDAGFYRAVAAAVYNEPQAEPLFKQVIRDGPTSEHAYEAYNWLANIYQKSGRYHSLATIRQAEWRAFPNKKEVASQSKEDAPFMDLPDQENGPRATFTLHHDGHSLPAPATINGKHVEFFFDNGADLSCISEDEAKHLGLTFASSAGVLGTMTESVGFRMATAKQVSIGGMQFKNVSFAVFPDDRPPMSLVPLDHRGIIGLPLMIAIGTFRWDARGSLTIGEKSERLIPEQSNLFFDAGDHLVLHATFRGDPIWMSLDSGATTTDIYAPFARQFSSYLQSHGKAGKNQIEGLGGSEEHDAIDLPELTFQIDGKNLALRPAHVMTKRADHREWISANAGKDLYMQMSGFTLDLQAMRLTLR